MFNDLLSIVLISTVLFSGNSVAFNPQTLITSGFVNILSDVSYSYYQKTILCKSVATLNSEYTNLKTNNAPVPKKLKDFETIDGQRECEIYFQNLFIMDLKIYKNSHLLIKSFKMFLLALEKGGDYKHFNISVDSFAYEPSTQKFVFVDFENLEKIENSKIDKITYKAEMARRFLVSIIEKGIYLTRSDIAVFKELRVDVNIFSKEKIHKEKMRPINIVEKNILEENIKNASSLIIQMAKEGVDFNLKVQHGEKITTFNQITGKDSFTIYLCQQSNNYLNCWNLNVDSSSIKIDREFSINENDRIDIEVQETFTQDTLSKRAFYEIFVIVNSNKSFGIPRSEKIYNRNSSQQINKSDLILCETTNQELIVLYYEDNKLNKRSLFMDNEVTKLNNIKKVIQISPHLLPDQLTLYSNQVTRVFFVLQGAKETIFVLKGLLDKLDFISFLNYEVGSKPIFLNECKKASSHLSLLMESENAQLQFKSNIKKYPKNIILVSDPSKSDPAYTTCYKETSENVLILSLEEELHKGKFFRWNFNSYQKKDINESRKSIVYFNEKYADVDPSIKYNHFEWPLTKPYVLFISISKYDSPYEFKVEFVFYKDDNVLYNVLFKKNVSFLSSEFPDKIVSDDINLGIDKKDKSLLFSGLNSVFLNDNEVIYQLEIANFKKCEPNLEIVNKKSLKIVCMRCVFSCNHPTKADSDKLTMGLKRVAAQALPLSVNDPKKPNTSDSNKYRRSRVLI